VYFFRLIPFLSTQFHISQKRTAMTSYLPVMIDGHVEPRSDESTTARRSNLVPRCNIWDDDKGFYVQLALPGWQALQVEVTNLMLTVKGRELEGTAQFSRAFQLPSFADYTRARAAYRQGLLTVSFPKRAESKPHRILVEVAQ
jgi:HSP20 family protein